MVPPDRRIGHYPKDTPTNRESGDTIATTEWFCLGDNCQIHNDLLSRWSEASHALSDAALNLSDLPGLEKARREAQKAHDAFYDHKREHGCGMDHPIVE